MSFATIVRLCFHLLPLVPLIAGRVYLACAAALLVFVCYVKTWKLTQEWLTLADGPERDKLATLRDRWRWLTFIR